MDLMEFGDSDLVGEAPCEFCGESFPLMLLIEHQSTHLEEFDNINIALQQHEEPLIKIDEKVQKTAPETASIVSKPEAIVKPKEEKIESGVKSPAKITETKKPRQLDFKDELLNVKKLQSQKIQDSSKGGGKSLIMYESELDVAEKEGDGLRVPNNPLLMEEKDVENINDLSDDDCSECLEEFWKRARDVLKQRVKIEN